MSAPDRVRVRHGWEDDEPFYAVDYTPPRSRRTRELRRLGYKPTLDGENQAIAGQLVEEYALGVRRGLELGAAPNPRGDAA